MVSYHHKIERKGLDVFQVAEGIGAICKSEYFRGFDVAKSPRGCFIETEDLQIEIAPSDRGVVEFDSTAGYLEDFIHRIGHDGSNSLESAQIKLQASEDMLVLMLGTLRLPEGYETRVRTADLYATLSVEAQRNRNGRYTMNVEIDVGDYGSLGKTKIAKPIKYGLKGMIRVAVNELTNLGVIVPKIQPSD